MVDQLKTVILSACLAASVNIACAAAPLAQAKATPEMLDAFVQAMGDVDETLKLEKSFAASVKVNDRIWLRQASQRIERGDVQMMANVVDGVDERFKDMALKMGPCHYAGLALRTAVMQAFARQLTLGKNASVKQALDQEANDSYAEQIRRCEIVKRLPRSARLIGNEGS